MCPALAERVGELLLNLGHGDQDAREELIPLVYGELRRIARRYLWQERPNHTFQNGALVHEAYLRLPAKRGAGALRSALDPQICLPQRREVDLVALDHALINPAALDPQQSRLIELRFFGGLSIEETSVVLGISPSTMKREWATVRAWLRREMKQKEARK